MGYTLLWLTHLAFVFLLIASACALSVRSRKSFWRRFWPLLITVFSFLSVAAYAIFGAFLINANAQPKWLLGYGLSASTVFVAGAFWILKRGLNGVSSTNPSARPWSPFKLILSTGALLLIFCIVLNAVETRIMLRLTRAHIEASNNLVFLLPAKLPDTLNARLAYESASESLGLENKVSKWLTENDKPGFDVTTEKVSAVLTAHRESLQLARKAADMPGFYLNPGTSSFYHWRIPKFVPYRNLARLLNLSARHKALNGDLSGALKDLTAIKKMAAHFRQFPLLISVMIGYAIERDRIAGLEFVLAYADQTALGNMELPLQTPASALSALWHAIQVEGQGQLQGFAAIAATADNLNTIFYEQNAVTPFTRLATHLWRVFLLPSDLRGALELAKFTDAEATSFDDIEQRIKKMQTTLESGEFGILTSMAMPNYQTYSTRTKQDDAHRSLAVLALAVSVYKNNMGFYPAKLEDLVPVYLDQIPQDPFDPKQTLKMKPVGGGIDLYSLGPASESQLPDPGAIHLFAGRKAYEEFRLKPAQGKKTKKK